MKAHATGTDNRGPGSRFSFTLHLDVSPSNALPMGRPLYALQDTCILVVDDLADNRLLLQAWLTAWGAQTMLAASAEQALELLEKARSQQIKIDLALLDLYMPDVSGLQLAKTIRSTEAHSTLPLVLFTSLGKNSELWPEIEATGFSGIITKPIHSETLRKPCATPCRQRY